jgi:hypothetical protein
MPGDAELYLLAEADRDSMLGGPGVLYLQSEANFTNTAVDGTGYPYGIEDVIFVTGANVGQARSANGWRSMGYTNEGININRTRTTVDWDSDQEAQVDIIHDAWQQELTTTLLQTTEQNYAEIWQGIGPTTATGASPAQTQVTFGKPTTLNHRRVATIHPDKNGRLWCWAFRDCVIVAAGALAMTRTGQMGLPIMIRPLSDDDISDVNDRVFRIYRTVSAVF